MEVLLTRGTPHGYVIDRGSQLHQHESGVSPSTINGAVSALRFLYDMTLKRRDLARARSTISTAPAC